MAPYSILPANAMSSMPIDDVGVNIDIGEELDDDLSLWSDPFCFEVGDGTEKNKAGAGVTIAQAVELTGLGGGGVDGDPEDADEDGLPVYSATPPSRPLSYVLPNITTDLPTVQDAAALLANELSQMSLEEQQMIQRDLHGALDPVDESDSSFVMAKLARMQACLNDTCRTHPSCAEAYRLALAQGAKYVCDPAFRLMFLRSERFDPIMAARRMMLHLSEKRILFGTDMLCKEHVELEDLNPSDKLSLYMRRITFLPYRDRAGRAIMHIRPKAEPIFSDEVSVMNVQRACWFETMNALRDELTQIHGTVAIVMESGCHAQAKLSMYRQFAIVREALPLRTAAMHFCIDDPIVEPLIPLIKYHSSRSCRTRFQYHSGKQPDLIQTLKGYGIAVVSLLTPCDTPPPIVPSSMEMALSKQIDIISRQRQWLLQRKRLLLKQQSSSEDAPWHIGENLQLTLPFSDGIADSDIIGQMILVSPHQSDNEDISVSSSSSPSAVASVGGSHSDSFTANDAPSDASRFVATTLTIEPTDADVLWGRGKSRENDGNRRAQALVRDLRAEYERGNRQVKTQVARHIVDRIQRDGGRFLKKKSDDEGWVVASDAEAREKIAKFFRKLRQSSSKGAGAAEAV